MRNLRQISDMMDRMLGRAGDRGLLYRNAEDERFTGRTIRIDARDMVHFGSCSYLGLELHEAVCAGGIDAIRRYGTQFSSSRIAASMPSYTELEALLGDIMGNPVLVAPTTSLAKAFGVGGRGAGDSLRRDPRPGSPHRQRLYVLRAAAAARARRRRRLGQAASDR